MTEPTELLPCPFCSGVAHIADDLITFYGECGTCGATSDYSSYKAGAVAKWNRRTPTPQPTQAQAGAVPKYRMLEPGVDRIEADDEYLQDDAQTWEKDPYGVFVGSIYGGALRPARRAIEAAHGIKGGQHG